MPKRAKKPIKRKGKRRREKCMKLKRKLGKCMQSHMTQSHYFDLRVLFDLGWLTMVGFPNMPQRQQPATLGEGGSTVGGGTLTVRHSVPPVNLPRRSIKPIDPTLRDGLRSLYSMPFSLLKSSWLLCLVFLKSPDRNWSFHTRPEDPCLLKDVEDLCNPAISLSLSLSTLALESCLLDGNMFATRSYINGGGRSHARMI